jgi:hypothetical protein
MNSVTNKKPYFQTVQKLQVIAIKISELAVRSDALLKVSASPAVTEGLIAFGLCKQAKEQLSAACQNLGFTVDRLPEMMNYSDEIENMLNSGATAVTNVIEQRFNVSRKAISSGIEGFVGEMLMMSAMMVSRAEEHVKEGERYQRELGSLNILKRAV